MTRQIDVSATYRLTVEATTFESGAPSIMLTLHYMNGATPLERGKLRFSMRAIPELLEALEDVWVAAR